MEQQAKSIEDHHAALAMLSSKMDMLLKVFNATHGNNQNMNESPEEHIPKQEPVVQGMQFRTIKIDFPRFDRENPTGWVYKANHYFVLNPMSDGQKILMSSFYLEGSALI